MLNKTQQNIKMNEHRDLKDDLNQSGNVRPWTFNIFLLLEQIYKGMLLLYCLYCILCDIVSFIVCMCCVTVLSLAKTNVTQMSLKKMLSNCQLNEFPLLLTPGLSQQQNTGTPKWAGINFTLQGKH